MKKMLCAALLAMLAVSAAPVFAASMSDLIRQACSVIIVAAADTIATANSATPTVTRTATALTIADKAEAMEHCSVRPAGKNPLRDSFERSEGDSSFPHLS